MSADFAHTLGAITPEYAEAAGGEVEAASFRPECPVTSPYVYSNDELRRLADGCTEVTCPYHGAYNAELVARGVPRHG